MHDFATIGISEYFRTSPLRMRHHSKHIAVCIADTSNISHRAIGIAGCIYLFISLPVKTQQFFVIAQIAGLILYMIYGSRAAEKARASG